MKTKCIFCDKETDEENLMSFGEEDACKDCHAEVYADLEKNGKEKLLEYPDGVKTPEELYEYIDDNPEWLEGQLGESASAWKITELNSPKKVTVKFIA